MLKTSFLQIAMNYEKQQIDKEQQLKAKTIEVSGACLLYN